MTSDTHSSPATTEALTTMEAANESETASPWERPTSMGLAGSVCWWIAALIVALKAWHHISGLPFTMPPSWYTYPHMWSLLALVLGLAGFQLMRQPLATPDHRWKPRRAGVRFREVIVYTKPHCHLCDQAKDVLLKYADSLPEIQLIDISEVEELSQRYQLAIPVVCIDGRERFRGRIDEFQLRRMIDAAEPLLPIAS